MKVPHSVLALTRRGQDVLDTPRAQRIATGGAMFTGTVAAGMRGSVAAQAIAYAGVVSLFGAAPAYVAGRSALSNAARRVDRVVRLNGLDDARAAAMQERVKARIMRPHKVMLAVGSGVTAGVVAGNLTLGSGRESAMRRIMEQEQAARPAIKSPDAEAAR